jgi:hypothetical protein
LRGSSKYEEAAGNKGAMAVGFEDIGEMYRQQADYLKALEYLLKH